ncbi:MAG: hypothetical protein M3077_10075 [Candidatus Dormibacteraeota bacterium]|nr:hypothetical protein [Candidatus Dormibacteraeota bacterium]
MPSKRGGTRAGDGVAPLAATLVTPTAVREQPAAPPYESVAPGSEPDVGAMQMGPADFLAGDLTQTLRRGAEVQRFAELAARQDALTPDESDELYRYRLRRLLTRIRQLERAGTGSDETAISEAVGDLQARLEELHGFETIRRQAGLFADHEVDLSAQERAKARLLDLAARRQRGLIAGSDQVPEQPDGSVRIRDLAFSPSPQDVPIYILAPASISSGSLTQHVDEVASQGARIHVVRDPSEIPATEPPPLILNWGSTHALPQGVIALNQPDAVRIASDQVESIRRLAELAPRTVANPEDVQLLGSDRVVAKRRHGSRGSGKAVLTADGPPAERAGYDLFQEFIPDRREYRVSVLSGRIASAYVKRPPDAAPPDDLHPAWTFDRAQVIPKAVAVVAKEAAHRIGLDYAGVDVIEDLHTGRVYCLEANSAPGMSQDTVKTVYAQIQKELRGRLARAD